MGIFNSLAYYLHTLEAMAFNRKAGLDKVNSLLNPIIHHLIKVAIYDYPKDRDTQVSGWEHEVLTWLVDIYDFCNNLKGNSTLKLRDYLLCLNDDLGRTSLVHSKVMKWSRAYRGKCKVNVNSDTLRLAIWDLLESQFKAMATQSWDENTLLQHPRYSQLIAQEGY